ncbi:MULTISPECIES: hypothetical protein [unclassified Mesorhizobium]|uniref:hypothetical protein n=1 Tax=unclassified Mesorhizobium TaxID=325217 RepID=UPI001128ADB4|nr:MULTISPECIES: hypothetical protein [unclassified Mesorhizobium]MCA0025464.1 hypothetical protein [Mesorhizobium sp. B263B1A]TPJ97147.1 hypothetical protein FJ489_11965 [Mesorhizobium sp. B2-5-12]TPK27186.1 hypothetical protein FJ562_08060 [Mesorhizobium sp. B2-5-6]
MAVQLADYIWRKYEVDGVSASGFHKPNGDDIRPWGTWVEGIITAFLSNGGLIYDTKAHMDADLAHGANSSAWVVGDAMDANNGIYRKLGASGAGSWTRVADLPYSFIKATDAGAGTANAIVATSSIPIPAADAAVLVNFIVFEANTDAPVTIAFNGGTPLTIKTASGNDVAAGGLVAGMVVAGYKSGSTFRLLTDQASAAIQAAAEAAAAAAAASAASINLPPAVADTFLQAKPDATGYLTKTATEVRNALAAAAYVVDRAAVKAQDASKLRAATTYGEGLAKNGTWISYLTSSLPASIQAAAAADTLEGIYLTSGLYTWARLFHGPIQTKWFNAQGDATYITGNTSIVSGAAALTVAGANFAAADVGKLIAVPGAGAAGIPLVANIIARVSASQVTLSANAGTTLAAVSTKIVYGTDDTTSVNKALQALPVTGGTVMHSGQSVVSSSISIGDGTTTTQSTRWGVRLVGDGIPVDPSTPADLARDTNHPSAAGFTWLGTYNANVAVVEALGYLAGFEVSNLRIDGQSSVRYGLRVTSAGYGVTDNLNFIGCRNVSYFTTVHAGLSGFSRNAELIQGKNIVIRMPPVSGCIGVLFDGNGPSPGSSCFNTLTGVRIFPDSTVGQFGVIFKVADTCIINDLLVFHETAAHASTRGVVYDYTGNGVFPCGCILNGVDAGWNLPASQQFAVSGSATGAGSVNLINNLTELNGCRYPTNLANVTLDLPRKYPSDVALTGQTGAIASTLVQTPKYATRYRVSFFMACTTAGSAGTATLLIQFTDPAAVSRNVSAGVLTLSSTANSIQGSVLVETTGSYINYQTTVAGITGSPQYSLYITVERMN